MTRIYFSWLVTTVQHAIVSCALLLFSGISYEDATCHAGGCGKIMMQNVAINQMYGPKNSIASPWSGVYLSQLVNLSCTVCPSCASLRSVLAMQCQHYCHHFSIAAHLSYTMVILMLKILSINKKETQYLKETLLLLSVVQFCSNFVSCVLLMYLVIA